LDSNTALSKMRFSILPLAVLSALNVVNALNIHLDVDVETERAGRSRLSQVSADDYVVEFGHGKHRGFLSDDGSYIKWSNIPYAAPPNDSDTRWAKPIYPEWKDGVLDGKGASKCTQADGTGSEDCLYLDVYVPKPVWDTRNERKVVYPTTAVFLHGGGFVSGSKDDFKKPDGLFKVAKDYDNEHFILVAPNYRLGIFGWLGGSKYRDDFGTISLGIEDQKAAIEWVNNEIARFGGSNRKTQLAGQEAGAASIFNHLTYFGGDSRRYTPKFQGVILHSPVFTPRVDDETLNQQYNDVLDSAGVKTLDDLANLSTDDLLKINKAQSSKVAFGPTSGSSEMPDVPSILLRDGKFFKNIAVYAGYAVNEDLTTKCNVHYLSNAVLSGRRSALSFVHRYVFGGSGGKIGSDLDYLFYPEKVQGGGSINSALADRYQRSWVNTVRFWDPNDDPEVDVWPIYQSDSPKVFYFGDGDGSKSVLKDDPLSAAEKKKCDDLNTSEYSIKTAEQQSGPSFYLQRSGRGSRHLEM